MFVHVGAGAGVDDRNALVDHAEEWVEQAVLVSPRLALGVVAAFRRRRQKHYSPAFAAAFALDPANYKCLAPGTHPRPPMRRLQPSQQEDVVTVVARLAECSLETARRELTLLTLGDWPTDMKSSVEAIVAETRTDEDGKTTTACISVRRGLWTFQGAGYFPHLRQAAVRLLSMHVTTAAAERNWSSWGNTYNAGRSQLNVATAEKMVYIKANIPSTEPSEPSQLLAEGITMPAASIDFTASQCCDLHAQSAQGLSASLTQALTQAAQSQVQQVRAQAAQRGPSSQAPGLTSSSQPHSRSSSRLRSITKQAAGRVRRGEARRGEARRGEARRGEARRGEARRGEARRGEARRGEARRGEARRGEARRGEARRGEARRGEARRGEARRGEARRGEARRGEARRGEARRGEARRGEARRGEARRGEARRGEARRGEARRGEARRGEARRGEARRGEARRGEARRGEGGR
ncbi:hypothetical protein QJQ45_017752 [Haematococcus lacustris]|nr:hypothetical protein QJQ45_017752 [Haematococcus lacustris]